MPIEHLKHGGTVITGESISYYRLCTMKGAVWLECKGIKVRRGPVVWKQAAREFGIKGNKHKVLAALEAMVKDAQRQQEHITEDGKRLVNGEEVQ